LRNFGELDRWILNRAKSIFSELRGIDESDFLRGFGLLTTYHK